MKCPILIIALVLFAHQAAAEPCNPVKIVDGDTIHFMRGTEKIKVRIAGYDAPERGQELGKAATARLKTIIQRGPDCNCTKLDRYGRSVCSVTVDGVDVSTAMIRAGFGCIDERFTKDTEPKLLAQNRQALEQAQKERRGIWSDSNPVCAKEYRDSKHR